MSKSLKNIGVLSFLTVVSRFLGMARDILGGAIFGESPLYAAWFLAFRLPNLFRRLLAEGSLTTAFIPAIQEEIHQRGKAGAYRLLSNVTTWSLMVSGSIVVLAMICFSQARLIPGHEARWYIAADFAVLLFPYLLFISLAAAFNATLNVQERFLEPALSPIWLNVSMIATLAGAGLHFAHTPLGELQWLTAGVLLGGFLQMAVPAGVLIADGWRPALDFTLSPWIRKIGAMMGPGIFGTAIYQINSTVSGALAFHINDAGTTLLFMANRLMELPIGVFAIAVSSVVYPLITKHAVEKNFDKMGEDFRKGLRLILVINVPAAVGLALLARPIVVFLYQHKNFGPDAAAQMAVLVAIFSIGLPFFSVVNLAVRAFYAIKDMATPVWIAAVDFVINVVLSVILMNRFGLAGLVMASTAAIVAQTLLLGLALRRKLPHLHLAPLLPTIGQVLVAAGLMALVVFAGQRVIESHIASVHGSAGADIFVLIPAGLAVYAIALWLLRIEGREDLVAIFHRVFRRGAKRVPETQS